ncbi:MAG: maleylpyruvate isomerase N-terminal domain-containing protein [Actinomycetes bacterium]
MTATDDSSALAAAFSADAAAVRAATDRLLGTLAALNDAQVGATSLLPGWSIGHTLSHIARNADGLSNLVEWAITGVEIAMYPSMAERNAAIESGATRSAQDLRLDISESSSRLAAQFELLAAADSQALTRKTRIGPPAPDVSPDTPGYELAFVRLRELELHHVDLGLPGYDYAELPASFVERALAWLDARSGPVELSGPDHEVLAWRLGRRSDPSVRTTDGADPGVAPAW